jgi:type VI protein secretion system component Hcp
MSLLHQESPKELDDAALGEEFTKGSGHVAWAAVAATILVTIAIAIYFIAGQKPPAVTGDVIAMWAYPHHTETPGLDANGAAMVQESFDQVLVFTEVRLHNQGKIPLFLLTVLTNATLDDGIHSSYAAGLSDYDRVFLAYPDIPVPHGKGLPINLELDPGQSVDGTFVSSFRLSKQQWDARKNLSFSFSFRYQPTLVLTPHSPVIEQ